MMEINDYIGQIQDYVACLANKDYQAAQGLTLSDSVPIQNIQRRLEEYRNEIITLPTEAFDLAQVYQITHHIHAIIGRRTAAMEPSASVAR